MIERWRERLPWTFVGIAVGLVVALTATILPGLLTDPDALEDGPIIILTGRDDSIGGQRQQLVNQWNLLHPQSPARIIELPAHADGQRSEMLARAQASGGEVDVFNLDVTWTAEFAENGYIRSLDESRLATGGFLDGPLATCRYGGRVWALPFNADVGLLYYRSDLIEDPPRTWEELEEQVDAVRARTGNGVDGYAGQFADYEGLTVNALEAVLGAGGSIVDESGDVVVRDQRAAVLEGLERLRAIAPAGVPELDEDTSIQLFQSGRTLFMRNWPRAHRSLAQDLEGAPAVPFEVAPLPGGSGVLGGQNLAISAQSARPRAAQALIEFLTGDRSQQILFERGGLPATRAVVYSDQAVRERYRYVAILEEALGTAETRPTQPHYARFSAVFRAAVTGYLRHDKPLADDLQAQLEAAALGRLTADDE
ncbi:multiple sugar transport system substrate-binding protein [Pseudonocardia hierapolitana]|uniref:Multiple sugar transport system substrate-binding protein n=1 Tax=Pseudonocardia hierapolitana TaxID=1128676 RepID=A0A561T3P6_9PSEU|nr:extracellular solute-binding protein [Pseudonocardia hierapolitana]TWF81726.1 multiple sugar transport system substrate-binding protein [Pseudonocardia hierapolitana]